MRTGLVLVLSLAACAGDATSGDPFAIVGVTPANGAIDVALDTAITLETSAPPPADFTVALTAETGEPIAHEMTIDGTTITLVPADPLWIATGFRIDAGDFASRFTSRDGAWRNLVLHTETTTAAAPIGGGAAPSLASLPDGTVLAGWEGGANVFDARFTPQAGWSQPNRFAIAGGDPDAVQLAAASPARAVIGYAKYVTRANIEARTYDGTQWSAPVVVSPSQVGTTRFDQFISDVAATAQTYAVLWHRGSFDLDQFDLYASIHGNGTWSAPILVEQLAGAAWGADIVDDGRGGYVIAWTQRSADKASTSVWVTTLSSTGAVGQPQMLDDGPGTTYSLSIARGGDTTWIAWMHQQGNIGLRVVARPFEDGSLGTAKQIDLDGYSFGGEWARITASARGALLAYTQYGGVFAALASGKTWGAVTTLDAIPMTNDDAGRPALALDDRGNATVAWTRVPQSGRRQTMVARATGGTFTPATQLDEGTASTYVWAAGVDAAGRVTTTWTQYDGSGYTVWGAHLQ